MGAPRKPAGSTNGTDRPDAWEKCVLAAYFRHLGYTQKESAAHAGCGERTIQTWEKCDWWPRACEEGLARWNGQLVSLARRGLVQALRDRKEYAAMAKWVAERMIKELAPPAVRAQLAGADGDPIDLDAAEQRVTGAIARLADAIATSRGDSGGEPKP